MKSKISNYMHKNPITLEENTPISKALILLNKQPITHILVTASGKLTGIVSKQDLLTKTVELLIHSSETLIDKEALKNKCLADMMGDHIVSVQPDDMVEYGVEILLHNKFHCLPVVDKNQTPVGIVTAIDLLKGYYLETGNDTISIW